ncbi:MAG: hypothetical protein ACLP6E_11450 [Acidimicrobiales bacterium]
MEAEGWYVDPYGIHEARWISAGKPTELVRDGRKESRDAPPSNPYTGPLEELPESAPSNGSDLLRADSAESNSFDPEDIREAAWDAFGETGGAM